MAENRSARGNTRRTSKASGSGARNRKVVLIVVLVAVVSVVAFFPVAAYTDRPAFCPSCHGMKPFYDAWQTGGHNEISCIECHVDSGYANRTLHKFVALQEVYAELFTHAKYPNYNADVPDARCLRCHPEIPTKPAAKGKFSHPDHLGRDLSCAKCHAATGHKVTFAALSQAGVLNTSNAPAGATYVGEESAGAPGKHSALPGHKPVSCSNCHDQASVQCSLCHKAPAKHFGPDCRQCHDPSVPFKTFKHRPNGPQCSACHKAPAKHFGPDCKQCHKPSVPFKSFKHPSTGEHRYKSMACAKCHPNGYATVYCTCHKGKPPRD